jgi:hypothetical protein
MERALAKLEKHLRSTYGEWSFSQDSRITEQQDFWRINNYTGDLEAAAIGQWDENPLTFPAEDKEREQWSRFMPHPLLVAAFHRYETQDRDDLVLELEDVYDTGTLNRVADWIIAARSQPKITGQGITGKSFGWIAEGDPIRVTSPTLGLEDADCLVVEKGWQQTNALFRFRPIRLPARDTTPTPEPVAAPVDEDVVLPIEDDIGDLMTLAALWKAPEGVADEQTIADAASAMVDFSAAGAPALKSHVTSTGNHKYDTTDTPPRIDAIVDMGSHFVTEYMAIASALSAKYRCGGIVFKCTGLSPGEVALVDLGGTYGSPIDRGDGSNTGAVFVTDWGGFDVITPATPPVPSSMPGTSSSGGVQWFVGWGSYAGWMHIQWHTLGSGAAIVRTYVSKIGDAWAGILSDINAGHHPYGDSGVACAVDGISDKLQVGYAGSHDTGSLKIACIYLGTDTAISTANLQAIHELFD